MIRGLLLAALLLVVPACRSQRDVPPFDKGPAMDWMPVVAAPREQPAQETDIFPAPRLTDRIRVVSGFEDPTKLATNISLRVERAWRVDGVNRFIVAIKNDTDKGTRCTFYVFAHNTLGQLLSTRSEVIFFQPFESVFREFSFQPAEGAYWSLAVK